MFKTKRSLRTIGNEKENPHEDKLWGENPDKFLPQSINVEDGPKKPKIEVFF